MTEQQIIDEIRNISSQAKAELAKDNPSESVLDDLDFQSLALKQQLNDVRNPPKSLTLAQSKVKKKADIDMRTRALIASGFTFDGSTFSLSENAQINWSGLNSAKDAIVYPVSVTTIDDGEYSLVDAPTVSAFFLTGVGVIKSHYDGGRALKIQVEAATTIDEVNNIVDNR